MAVLPFTNLSVAAEDAYFTDGITDELIGMLSTVEGLRVAARTSSNAFKGRDVDLAEVGSKLRVDAVLGRWPEAWPTLPAALAAQSQQLPVRVTYAGKTDFSDPLQLAIARAGIELQAAVRVPELQRWLAADAASPPARSAFSAR